MTTADNALHLEVAATVANLASTTAAMMANARVLLSIDIARTAMSISRAFFQGCPDPNCLNCAGSQQSCIKCSEGFYVDRTDDGSVGCVGKT